MSEQGSIRSGIRLLRRHHEGVLAFDERVSPFRFIIDGRTGRIVAPVEPPVMEAFQHVVSLPDQSEPEMEVLLSPERIDPDWDEGCDRWHAYFGEAREAMWASCVIESAKTDRWVFDGDALMLPNDVRDAEPKLVRALNEDLDRLRRICAAHAGVEVQEPLAVGVDREGIDVRARFGIVRIEFDETDERAIDARVGEMLRDGG